MKSWSSPLMSTLRNRMEGSGWFFSPELQTLLVVAVVKNSNRTGVFCGTAPGDWWLITTQLLLKAAGPLLLITAFVSKRRLSHRRSLLEALPPCESIKITQEIAGIHQPFPSVESPDCLCAFKNRYCTLFCVSVCGRMPPVAVDLTPTEILASNHV